MEKFNRNRSNSDNSLILVPQAFLDSLEATQKEILEKLDSTTKKESVTGEYVSESLAKEQLGKKTTWFWEQRKNGVLPYVKVGGKVFYHKKDILRLFELFKKGGQDEL
jgi:hypothetical protein